MAENTNWKDLEKEFKKNALEQLSAKGYKGFKIHSDYVSNYLYIRDCAGKLIPIDKVSLIDRVASFESDILQKLEESRSSLMFVAEDYANVDGKPLFHVIISCDNVEFGDEIFVEAHCKFEAENIALYQVLQGNTDIELPEDEHGNRDEIDSSDVHLMVQEVFLEEEYEFEIKNAIRYPKE